MRTTDPRVPVPRRRLTRRTVIAGFAAAGAAAAVACSSESDSAKSTPTGAGATTATGAAATQAAPKGDFFSTLSANPPDPFTDRDIQTGGTLTRLFSRQTPLDYFTTSSPSAVGEVTTPVYSRLIRLACRANMKSVVLSEL